MFSMQVSNHPAPENPPYDCAPYRNPRVVSGNVCVCTVIKPPVRFWENSKFPLSQIFNKILIQMETNVNPSAKVLSKRLRNVLSNKENFVARGTDIAVPAMLTMFKKLNMSLFLREKSWYIVNDDNTKVLWGPKDSRITSPQSLIENKEELVIRFSPERGKTWDDLEQLEDIQWLRSLVPSLRFLTANTDEDEQVDF